jgi:hypothetical protein
LSEKRSGVVKNPRPRAVQKATKMPNWAAAPSSMVFGLAIMGPKSVSAPRPRNIRGGRMFQNESV